MRIRSELQRYLFDRRFTSSIVLLFALLSILFLKEYALILVLCLLIFVLIRKRVAVNIENSLISIIEKKPIDRESNILLIEYSGVKYLLLYSKGYCIKITEEKNNG